MEIYALILDYLVLTHHSHESIVTLLLKLIFPPSAIISHISNVLGFEDQH